VLSAVVENGHIRADGLAEGTATITGYHQDMVYWDDGMDCYGFLMNFAGDCMGDVVKPKIFLSSATFSPAKIPKQNGSATLTVELSASTTVPPNTTVTVEAFDLLIL